MDEHTAEILKGFEQEVGWVGRSSRLRFSARMRAVYGRQLRRLDQDPAAWEFRRRYGDYQLRKANPDQIEDLADVAGELWQLFPTHFFKVQHAFLSCCLPSERRAVETTPFGCTTLHLLDVGAGVGTASLAVIDLLMSWQTASMQAGHAPAQIRVVVIPVEPNRLKIPVLRDMLSALESEQQTPLVQVSVAEPICHDFPQSQCTEAISTALNCGGYHLLVCLSNILSWVREWRPSLKERLGEWWRRVKSFLRLPAGVGTWPDYLGPAAELLASLEFDHKTVVACETRGEELAQQVRLVYRCLRDNLRAPAYATPPWRPSVRFENPPGSFWRRTRRNYEVPYSCAQLTTEWPQFRDEPGFTDAFADDMLRVAWARTRWMGWRSFLTDEVEIKLFEASLAWRVDRLRRLAFSRALPDRGVPDRVCYDVPKAPADGAPGYVSRTMTQCGFEESIALVALLQASRRVIEADMDDLGSGGPLARVSFGNRLNPRDDDEYLYSYFVRQHRAFLSAASSAARACPDGSVTRTDVLRYYDSVKLGTLHQRLDSLMGNERRRALRAWRAHLLWRPSPTGIDPDTMQPACDRGIPQGHPTSGALANVYLTELDQHMRSLGRWRERFFRYVDDMVAISEAVQAPEAAEQEISRFVSQPHLGLRLNAHKTLRIPCEGFTSEYDARLHELSEGCHRLVRRTYRLPRTHLSAFRGNQWGFCRQYSRLLSRLGIRASPRHLVRKLQPELSWAVVLGAGPRRAYGPPLRVPRLPADEEGDDDWVRAVEERNHEWVDEREHIGASLAQLARASLEIVTSSAAQETATDKNRAARALRFAAFRLTVIRSTDGGPVFRDLLSQPWLVNPRYTAQGLAVHGCQDELIGGLEHSNETVAACCALAAGEHGLEAARGKLWALATTGSHPLVRTIAVEALLRLQSWGTRERERLREAVRNEEHPAPLKSLVILGCAMGLSDITELGHEAFTRTSHQQVLDAWAYARRHTGENLLSVPDVPPPRYSADYPDFEDSPEYYATPY